MKLARKAYYNGDYLHTALQKSIRQHLSLNKFLARNENQILKLESK